jgi:hypothetical protein
MKNNFTLRRSLGLLVFCALCYILLHFMFDLGNFPLFKGVIGPKNVLPIVTGMLLGPFAAFGIFAGAAAVGILSGAGITAIISETVGAVIMTCGGWLLWYARKGNGTVSLKKVRDLIRFTVISLILSALCGLVSYFCGLGFLLTFVSYMSWNLLIGIPVIMLMTSIFCVNVVYPPWHPAIFEINETLPLKTESIAVITDEIDELCFQKKLDNKRAIFLMSYIEECILMILSEPTCKSLLLTVQISDCISINMMYDGKRCNPLRSQRDEDQIGLDIIKQRALRARHSYSGKRNYLHIVQ